MFRLTGDGKVRQPGKRPRFEYPVKLADLSRQPSRAQLAWAMMRSGEPLWKALLGTLLLSWSSPSTQSTGDLITAAIWNQNVVDNTLFLYDPPGCRVYNSGNESITASTPTVVTFDTERFDTDGIHSTSSNTGRLTCQTAGVYLIVAHGVWASAPGSGSYTSIRLNGTTDIAKISVTTASLTNMSIATIYKLGASDYVENVVLQGSGGPINLSAVGNSSPEFGMQWMSAG